MESLERVRLYKKIKNLTQNNLTKLGNGEIFDNIIIY